MPVHKTITCVTFFTPSESKIILFQLLLLLYRLHSEYISAVRTAIIKQTE